MTPQTNHVDFLKLRQWSNDDGRRRIYEIINTNCCVLLTNFNESDLLTTMLAAMHYQNQIHRICFRITHEAVWYNEVKRKWSISHDCYGLWYFGAQDDDLSQFWQIYDKMKGRRH